MCLCIGNRYLPDDTLFLIYYDQAWRHAVATKYDESWYKLLGECSMALFGYYSHIILMAVNLMSPFHSSTGVTRTYNLDCLLAPYLE